MDGEQDLRERSSLTGVGTMFTNTGREAPVMGNAGDAGCGATGLDTVFWGFERDGTIPSYLCADDHVGTSCGTNKSPYR